MGRSRVVTHGASGRVNTRDGENPFGLAEHRGTADALLPGDQFETMRLASS